MFNFLWWLARGPGRSCEKPFIKCIFSVYRYWRVSRCRHTHNTTGGGCVPVKLALINACWCKKTTCLRVKLHWQQSIATDDMPTIAHVRAGCCQRWLWRWDGTTGCQHYGDVRGKISLTYTQENFCLLWNLYQQKVGLDEWHLSGHLLEFNRSKYLRNTATVKLAMFADWVVNS